MNVTRKLPWLLVLLVTLLLALVAAGCGGDDDETATRASGDTSAATDEATTEEAEPISVGLVTDIGGLNDRGFNSLANEGLERAASELGAEIRVLESKSDADYIPNLSTLAEEGFDLVISVGFLMGEATHAAAEEFPDTSFAIIDNAYGGEGCEETNTCELAEPAGAPLQGAGDRLPRRLPGRARDRDEHDLERRRHQDPAGRPVHRRLPGGRTGVESRHHDA